jgi:hypothetical protein
MTDAMPPAMALRKEAAGFPHSLLDLRTEHSVRAVLEDYNRRVRLDRLRPVVGPFPPMLARTVDVDELVDLWRGLRAERNEDEPPRLPSAVRALPSNPSLARYDSEPWWRRILDVVRGR